MTRLVVLSGYGLSVLVFLAVWMFSRRPASNLPKLSNVWRRILANRTTRVALVIVWWWLGYHFLVHVIPVPHVNVPLVR